MTGQRPTLRAPEPRANLRPARLFPAMRVRDFRLLWTGLLISNVGTWMQFTTLAVVVVQIAPTPALGPLYLGLLGAARAIPVLLLSPVAGVVADTVPRRRVLLITNTATSVLALVLALLASFKLLHIGGLLAIAAAQAATQSFDAPARQSWVPQIVPREYLGNAIGLNSIAFNAPLMLGPAVAGLLIAQTGVATSFYINAVATLAVVVAVILMRPTPVSSSGREPMLQSIREGIRFLAEHPVLRWILLLLLVSSLLVRPFTQQLTAFAINDLQTDVRGVGYLLGAAGIGTFLGAIITALFPADRPRAPLWFVSGTITSLGLMALAFVHQFGLATVLLIAIGLGTMAFIGSTNVLLQTLSPDQLRGRAISVYSMILLGLVPLGSLVLGTSAAFFGLPWTFFGGGAITLVLGLWVWFAHPALRRA